MPPDSPASARPAGATRRYGASLERVKATAARAVEALVRQQTSGREAGFRRGPWMLLVAALATVLLAGFAASRLKLKTSFGELLPQNKESVIVANQVNERLTSTATLTVVAEGRDPTALKRFVDALTPELLALGPHWVGAVDDGVRATRAFFEKNKLVYAPLEDVQRIHDEIVERYDYEVARETGLLVDDTDAPPPITAEAVRKRIAASQEKAGKIAESFPDGYYMEPDQHMIAVLIRTPVSFGDFEEAAGLMTRVKGAIEKTNPRRFDESMAINFTGDFITGAEEYATIKNDLSHVGAWGVAMILGVVFLFYLRLRTLVAMAVAVGIGVVWTFGFARLAIGHLNSSTGFLVSIVVGNGLNFGVLYMARYLEARRSEGVPESVRVAHRETWLSTLAAALAAMVAYGSLIVTDFRGFKHFGLIGGAGMVLCWISTYLFLPAVLVLFERRWPLRPAGLPAKLRGLYGVPFAYFASRFPRAIAVTGIALGVVATGLSLEYLLSDPMEYDLSNVRTEGKVSETSARQLGRRVDKIVGRQGQDGLAIMADDVAQVLPLKAALEARRDAAAADRKPFDAVVTIFDLLPKDQEKKIAMAVEVRDRLERAHRRGLIHDADWAEIEQHLPPKDMRPIGIDELPEQVARPFAEKDGRRGRLVYIVPATGRSVWDAHYLIEWADSFRRTTLPDGSVVKGSGRSVIFADLVLAVVEDAPKAVLVSLMGTLLIVVVAFRGRRAAFAVVGTLLLGIVWMIATMTVYKAKIEWRGLALPHVELESMKLNFLNFVALPISIGVGADYAVNVMQRYLRVGRHEIRRVILETGGAVILCSLTTTLGYLALTLSVNHAIVSFGIAAAAGEIGCILAAVLVLPACLEWYARRYPAAPALGKAGARPEATPMAGAMTGSRARGRGDAAGEPRGEENGGSADPRTGKESTSDDAAGGRADGAGSSKSAGGSRPGGDDDVPGPPLAPSG